MLVPRPVRYQACSVDFPHIPHICQIDCRLVHTRRFTQIYLVINQYLYATTACIYIQDGALILEQVDASFHSILIMSSTSPRQHGCICLFHVEPIILEARIFAFANPFKLLVKDMHPVHAAPTKKANARALAFLYLLISSCCPTKLIVGIRGEGACSQWAA